MALIDIISAVNTTLTAVVPGVVTGFGRAQRTQRAVPPMVTWIPSRDTFDGPDQHSNFSRTAPDSIGTRAAGLEIHVWGAATNQAAEDFSATETLLNAVLSSLKQTIPRADLRFLGGEWLDATPGAEATAYGRAYLLQVAIRVPIFRVAASGGATTVTSVPTGTVAVFPDGQAPVNP